MSFKGKVVIITGGSSGIGATTAVFFTREGATVTIVSRNEMKLKKVTEDIKKIGKTPIVIIADVSKEDDTKAILNNTVAKFGKLDVLVNNAGIYRMKTVYEEDHLQTYDEVNTTNLRSVVHLTILDVPHLIKSGNIVNISSIEGKSPLVPLGRGFSAYCTSKAGVDHFSRVTALELSDKGIRVNVVSPGPVESYIFENSGIVVDKKLAVQNVVDQTALKILTQPEEVANLILFLASDKAKSITGADYLMYAGARLML